MKTNRTANINTQQPESPRALSRHTITQFIKYGMVGVSNTLITFIVIYVCKSFLGIKPMGANAIGYAAGLINSFVWNKTWVFRSKRDYRREALKFAVGFALCYVLQFVVVWALTYRSEMGEFQWQMFGLTFSGYAIATVVGNVVYTLANFVYNRLITFK